MSLDLRGFYGFRFAVLAAAIAGVGWPDYIRASGTFDGDQVSISQQRQWTLLAPNPGLNWALDTIPTAAESLTFMSNGNGWLDLQLNTDTHPNLSFGNWVSYRLHNGTLNLSGATLSVADTVHGTYGSSYFADGNEISAALTINAPLTINFTGTDDGALRLSGSLSGAAAMGLTSVAGVTGNRGVYFDQPNAAYSGMVHVGTLTSARLLGAGRVGTGPISLAGGELQVPGGEVVNNPISSAVGTVRAGGAMDLNDNDLLMDYTGPTPITVLRGYLLSGQLFSSTANASVSPKFAIGYGENTTGLTVFSGQAVDSTTLLVAYTLAGDANLDGKVNTIDLNNLQVRLEH